MDLPGYWADRASSENGRLLDLLDSEQTPTPSAPLSKNQDNASPHSTNFTASSPLYTTHAELPANSHKVDPQQCGAHVVDPSPASPLVVVVGAVGAEAVMCHLASAPSSSVVVDSQAPASGHTRCSRAARGLSRDCGPVVGGGALGRCIRGGSSFLEACSWVRATWRAWRCLCGQVRRSWRSCISCKAQ